MGISDEKGLSAMGYTRTECRHPYQVQAPVPSTGTRTGCRHSVRAHAISFITRYGLAGMA